MKKIISVCLVVSLFSVLTLPCTFSGALECKTDIAQASSVGFDTLAYEGIELPHEEFKTETSFQNSTQATFKKMFGDVNKDGMVEAADILRLMGNLAGNVSDDDISPTFSDVNFDNSIDMLDVVTLQRHIAGWENYEKLPYGADVYAGAEAFMPDVLYYEPLNFEGGFAYDTLNSTQKEFYNEIVASVENMDSSYLYSELSSLNEVLLCYFAVRGDHPEYFWLANRYGYTTTAPYCLVLYYNCDEQTKDSMTADIKDSLQTVVDLVGDTDYSDYEVELLVHDYLVTNITYDTNAASTGNIELYPHAWNVYGALTLNSCVCEGYAESFMLIMKMFGIKCGLSTGSVHMWNYILLDGDFYYVDVTWDDSDYNNLIYYTYFNVTYDFVQNAHPFYPVYSSATSNDIQRGNFNIFTPICTATKYNYDRMSSTILDDPTSLVTDFANAFIKQSAEAYKKGFTQFDARFYIESNSGIDASEQTQNIIAATNQANNILTDYTLNPISYRVNNTKTLLTITINIIK